MAAIGWGRPSLPWRTEWATTESVRARDRRLDRCGDVGLPVRASASSPPPRSPPGQALPGARQEVGQAEPDCTPARRRPEPRSVCSPSTRMATSSQNRQLLSDYGPPSLGYTQGTGNSQVPQSKYAELLAIIEELGKEIRPTYAGSKSAMERLKRGIIHARSLVRECLAETERNARS